MCDEFFALPLYPPSCDERNVNAGCGCGTVGGFASNIISGNTAGTCNSCNNFR